MKTSAPATRVSRLWPNAALCIAAVVLSCRHESEGVAARRTDPSSDSAATVSSESWIGRFAKALGIRTDSEPPPYTGLGPEGIPNYASRSFSIDERAVLRQVYGVEDPNRLYVSDSTEDGLLKYDTEKKQCRTCYVNSYRVGFVSVRRAGESWEELERRVKATKPIDFPTAAHVGSTSTDDLDPDVRPAAEQMLADARRAGFRLRVTATYRSPEREAYLMAKGRGRTHTLTSLHSYGRALDIVIGDGNLRHRATRESWVAFRRWVVAYKGNEFRILGTPDWTWDWPHVEMPSPTVGFRTIEAALARARVCSSPNNVSCDFKPHLPAAVDVSGAGKH